MKACWPLTGGRSISDRRQIWPQQGRVAKGAGVLALALFCVLVIALLQRAGWLDGLDLCGMRAAGAGRDSGAGGFVTPLMQAATWLGGTLGRLLVIAVCLCGLLLSGRRQAARWFVLVMAGGTLLNLALKQVFAAPRPDLLPHLDIVNSYSFPSGHAAGNMMLFGALALLLARPAAFLAAGAMIALIGASRIWLGVHWPSDVLAGWIEGLGWLFLCRAWLPARRGQQQSVAHAADGRHAVGGDEAVDPETVDYARHRDEQ